MIRVNGIELAENLKRVVRLVGATELVSVEHRDGMVEVSATKGKSAASLKMGTLTSVRSKERFSINPEIFGNIIGRHKAIDLDFDKESNMLIYRAGRAKGQLMTAAHTFVDVVPQEVKSRPIGRSTRLLLLDTLRSLLLSSLDGSKISILIKIKRDSSFLLCTEPYHCAIFEGPGGEEMNVTLPTDAVTIMIDHLEKYAQCRMHAASDVIYLWGEEFQTAVPLESSRAAEEQAARDFLATRGAKVRVPSKKLREAVAGLIPMMEKNTTVQINTNSDGMIISARSSFGEAQEHLQLVAGKLPRARLYLEPTTFIESLGHLPDEATLKLVEGKWMMFSHKTKQGRFSYVNVLLHINKNK